MFLGLFRFTTDTKFLLKNWILIILGASRHFYCVRGPSLVELTGDDSSLQVPLP